MDWFDDFFPDWDDIALAASMGEAFADDELERRRLENELDRDDDSGNGSIA